MTEAEWLAGSDLDKMLDWLLNNSASERKLRLFACSCCFPLLDQVKIKKCRDAFEAVLHFADGIIDAEAFHAAAKIGDASQPLFPDANRVAVAAAHPELIQALAGATRMAWAASARIRSEAVKSRARAAVHSGASPEVKDEAWDEYEATIEKAEQAVKREQVFYLQCIFGNPFRPITVNPAWLTWNEGALLKMAQTIYDEKRFQDLPIFADALEEAGCLDEDILGHCRHDWEHFRGCHVLDAILGKV